jgi:secretion/DNA translocation related CpaE-like protein
VSQPPESEFLLVSADPRLIDEVLAVAAAVAVQPVVATDASVAAARWGGARTVLVGDDLAAELAAMSLPIGPTVHLVGSDPARLSAWSMPLRASVVELPAGAAWLTGILAGGEDAGLSPVVAVVGGSGGVGASTLAAGLAYRAARRGTSTVLVDADPFGGGIDLLLGAERTSGWRWDRFARAEGQMGDLRPVLPTVEGLGLLSMGRRTVAQLAREPVSAVLGSLRRSYDLIVIDPGRSQLPGSLECCRLATSAVLLASCSVRGVAAAQQTLTTWTGVRPLLVARRRAGTGVGADVVADALQMPVAGVLPDDPELVGAAERGDPPGRSLRRRRGWGRSCATLLEALT